MKCSRCNSKALYLNLVKFTTENVIENLCADCYRNLDIKIGKYKKNKGGGRKGQGVYQQELRALRSTIANLYTFRETISTPKAYITISQAIWKLQGRVRVLQANRYYQFDEAA